MSRATACLIAILSGVLAACQLGVTPTATGTDQLNVVATYSILGDVVENVGGDQIKLNVLVGPNSDAHAFEPSPADGVKLAEAALVFENGLGFETWLDDLYEASDSGATRVVTTQGIEPRTLDGEVDPHVWHSVANVSQMTQTV